MTNSKALIERLRADWPEILVEKHWMMDSDAIEEQRREAADAIEELDRHLTLSGKVNKALSERIEKLEAEKAVVADLWEQQKEIALDYLDDCNKAADHIEKLEADNARLREALEEFVASTGVSDDPDVLLVDALVYENAMRVLGLQK